VLVQHFIEKHRGRFSVILVLLDERLALEGEDVALLLGIDFTEGGPSLQLELSVLLLGLLGVTVYVNIGVQV
jgi:hypothetical protein